MKKHICRTLSIILLAISILFNNSVISSINADISKTQETKVYLDADDFENLDDYYDYVKRTGDYSNYTGDEDVKSLKSVNGSSIVQKGNTYQTVGKNATLRYTLTDLKCNSAIQKAYIGGTYIYVVQRSGKNVFLSRCLILENQIAKYQDRMALGDFGHCQTLEAYLYGGETYFWMSGKSSSLTGALWATQVIRVKYETTVEDDINAGKYKYYYDFYRLSYMSKANKQGKSIGTTKRVDAALSSNGKKLLTWSKTTDNWMQFTVYDNKKINDAFNSSNNKSIPCNNSAIKNACDYSFKLKKKDLLTDGSMQGLEMTDNGSIYMASGQKSHTKKIIKLNKNGNVKKEITISNSNLKKNTGTEIEGLQLLGNYLYFGICNHNQTKTTQYIYSLPKADFN